MIGYPVAQDAIGAAFTTPQAIPTVNEKTRQPKLPGLGWFRLWWCLGCLLSSSVAEANESEDLSTLLRGNE